MNNLKPDANDNVNIIAEIEKLRNENECKDIGKRKVSGIYKIVNKVNGKYYVGSSENIQRRWNCHKRTLNKNCHRNDYLQRAWNKYRSKNFLFIIIEVTTPQLLLNTEQKYLNKAKLEQDKCYNLMFDAGLGSPCKNEYSKLKMIKGLKKYYKTHNGPMHEKTHKESTRKKMSINHANVCGSKNPMYGRHHTKEVIERIRKLNKVNFLGEKNFNYDKTIYNFQNKITGEIFTGTQYHFRKKHNLGGCVCNLVNGKRKSHKNWVLLI